MRVQKTKKLNTTISVSASDMNFLKLFLHKREERKTEQKVIARYQELAGAFGASGEMLNRDKESRARAWVKEQEKLAPKSEPFWNSRTIQAAFIGGGFTILAVLLTFYLAK